MYSRISVCKTCYKRVLDEQLVISSKHVEFDSCIYCLIKFLDETIDVLYLKRQDQLFAFDLLERNRKELLHLYESAIFDNGLKEKELAELNKLLHSYTNGYKVDVNKLIG